MKTCCTCKETKPESDFIKRGNRTGSWCKECKRAYDRAYWAKTKHTRLTRKSANQRKISERNIKYIWRYLQQHPCIDCKESDPIVLEFDHIDNKEANVSDLARHYASIDRIQREINKCVVRCANCHRRKTASEQGWYQYISQDMV